MMALMGSSTKLFNHEKASVGKHSIDFFLFLFMF